MASDCTAADGELRRFESHAQRSYTNREDGQLETEIFVSGRQISCFAGAIQHAR
jgi:hypothetical protein